MAASIDMGQSTIAGAIRKHRLSHSGIKAAEKASVPAQDPESVVTNTSMQWSPSSWTIKPIKQEVVYKDRKGVEQALSKLEGLPPIVTPKEIVKLKNELRDVALGKAFLLQGGDCAELFDYCEGNAIDAKIKLLLQMSLILIWGARKRVIRIARLAGQYAKPRSKPTEIVNGVEIPSFRGDILNGYEVEERVPDPSRLVSAYFHSAATMNYVRAQIASGMADLHAHDWDLGHMRGEEPQHEYQRMVAGITDFLDFFGVAGIDTGGPLETVDLYTSHEGLLLEYEQSLTRHLRHPANRSKFFDVHATANGDDDEFGWYNTSAHFLWIGDRTRQINGGHVEYFRGIENPIGVKVGPTMTAIELVELLDIVNPRKEIGKVTLITRYGHRKVNDLLGLHIEAVKKSGHIVVWQCDPMHGNTRTTSSGIKTRYFSDIISEVSSALHVHQQHGSFLGGIHLELTGEAVTECVGGSEGLVEDDLNLNYTTYCDPRLNEKQALELAYLVAGHLRGARKEHR